MMRAALRTLGRRAASAAAAAATAARQGPSWATLATLAEGAPRAASVAALAGTAAFMGTTVSFAAGNQERSFIMIKPDGVHRGLVGDVIKRFEQRGYKLVGIKVLVPSRELAGKHYAEHEGKPFFPKLVDFLSSGAVVAMVFEGKDIVKAGRGMIGATNPLASAPGTIRADYGIDMGRNIIHGSDSVESAMREIALWFKADELADYKPVATPWIYDLHRLLREKSAERPRRTLSVQTTRRRVPRIHSVIVLQHDRMTEQDRPVTPTVLAPAAAPAMPADADRGGGGGGGEPQAGGAAPLMVWPGRLGALRRVGSMSTPLPITPRIQRTNTAPEGFPDSLLVAAVGGGSIPCSPSSGGGNGGRPSMLAAAGARTLPSHHPLHAQGEAEEAEEHGQDVEMEITPTTDGVTPTTAGQSFEATPTDVTPGSYDSQSSSGSTSSLLTCLSAPPVTLSSAVAAAARRRRRQQAEQSQQDLLGHQPCSFRELFAAQAEATHAQARIQALQAALQKRDEQLARMELEMAAVSAERDLLRNAVGEQALQLAAATGRLHAPQTPQHKRRLSISTPRYHAAQPKLAPAAAAMHQPVEEGCEPQPSLPSTLANDLPFAFD